MMSVEPKERGRQPGRSQYTPQDRSRSREDNSKPGVITPGVITPGDRHKVFPEQKFTFRGETTSSLLPLDQAESVPTLNDSIEKISDVYTDFLTNITNLKNTNLNQYITFIKAEAMKESIPGISGGTLSITKKSHAKSRGYRAKYKKFKGGAGPNEEYVALRPYGPAIILITNNLIDIGLFCVAAGMTRVGFEFLENYMGIVNIVDESKDLIIGLFNLIITCITSITNMGLGITTIVWDGLTLIPGGVLTIINMVVTSISNMGFSNNVIPFLIGRHINLESGRAAMGAVARGTVAVGNITIQLTTLITNFYRNLATGAENARNFFGNIFTRITPVIATIGIPQQVRNYTKEYWLGLIRQFYETIELNRRRDLALYNKMAIFGYLTYFHTGANPTPILNYVATGGIIIATTAQVTYNRSIYTFNAAYAAARTYDIFHTTGIRDQQNIRARYVAACNQSLQIATQNLTISQRRLRESQMNGELAQNISINEYIVNLYNYALIKVTEILASTNHDMSNLAADSIKINEAVLRFCIFAEQNRDIALRLIDNYTTNYAGLITILTPNADGNITLGQQTILAPPIPGHDGAFPFIVPDPAPAGVGAAAPPPPGPGGSRKRKTRRKHQRRRTRRF